MQNLCSIGQVIIIIITVIITGSSSIYLVWGHEPRRRDWNSKGVDWVKMGYPLLDQLGVKSSVVSSSSRVWAELQLKKIIFANDFFSKVVQQQYVSEVGKSRIVLLQINSV